MLRVEGTESKSHLLVMRFSGGLEFICRALCRPECDCAALHYSTACALPLSARLASSWRCLIMLSHKVGGGDTSLTPEPLLLPACCFEDERRS